MKIKDFFHRYKWRLFTCFIVLLGLFGMFNEGKKLGYKKGQIDYAQHKVVYTVIDGQIIHIMGEAPPPEIKLTPIPEKK